MITQEFIDVVSSHNLDKVKIMLKNSLTMDLTFTQFKMMLEYTLKYLPNIIEVHDGTVFEPRSKWNKPYASSIKAELVDNFSAERIEHIKEVQQYVYANELKIQAQNTSIVGQPSTRSTSGQQSIHSSSTANSVDTELIVSLIVGLGVGAASILLGIVKGHTIVNIATTAIITTVVVGGVTYYIVKKK